MEYLRVKVFFSYRPLHSLHSCMHMNCILFHTDSIVTAVLMPEHAEISCDVLLMGNQFVQIENVFSSFIQIFTMIFTLA
jgi:hypothetical protein